MNIIEPSVFMKLHPDETSILETECLFGETVEILHKFNDWVYCKLLTDDYHGWVKISGLGQQKKVTHRVIVKRSFIYKKKDPKSNCLLYLPLGAKLSIEDIKYDWAKVSFVKKDNFQVGYVPTKHIVKLKHIVDDWVAIAETLVDTPYKWGGRDTIGIDCSALLQLSCEAYGNLIPRNTTDQININKKVVFDLNKLERGCVVFWKGHVGIMTDRINCIHANAFHMKTVIEPLEEIIKRMDNKNNIIKILNFN